MESKVDTQALDEINQGLNYLKAKLFDRIEIYKPSQNVGLRSLKNLGVWLCVYALTDKEDQKKVIQELIKDAEITDIKDITSIKKIINTLSAPKNLKYIINGYEAANGSFFISVKDEVNLGLLNQVIKERGYQTILSKHVKIGESQQADIIFEMNNQIKFKWAGKTRETAGEFKKVKGRFRNTEMEYLLANSKEHQVQYNLVIYEGRRFHVVQLGALQDKSNPKNKKNKATPTNAYLIESVDPADAIISQQDYFNIITLAKQQNIGAKKTHDYIQDKTNTTYQATNLTIPIAGGECDDYYYKVHFPQIAESIITTEQRLGGYKCFGGKEVGQILASIIEYKGKRKLTYDNKGGEIKNKEKVSISKGRQQDPIYVVYTVTNAFMMVYEASNGADYYPYFIADPTKELRLSFDKEDKYPTLASIKAELKLSKPCFTAKDEDQNLAPTRLESRLRRSVTNRNQTITNNNNNNNNQRAAVVTESTPSTPRSTTQKEVTEYKRNLPHSMFTTPVLSNSNSNSTASSQEENSTDYGVDDSGCSISCNLF